MQTILSKYKFTATNTTTFGFIQNSIYRNFSATKDKFFKIFFLFLQLSAGTYSKTNIFINKINHYERNCNHSPYCRHIAFYPLI